MTTDSPLQTTSTSSMDRMLLEAVAHHQSGEFPEAEKCYRAILQIEPAHPKANHNLGALNIQQKRFDAGLACLLVALEAEPTCAQYWLSYIDALKQAGQLDDAKQLLALAMQQGLQGAEVDALLQSLEGTLQENDPGNPDQRRQEEAPARQEIDMLVSLFNQGRYREAEDAARIMASRFPRHWMGWKMLGVLFSRMGRSAEALGPLQQAVALSPGDAEANNNLGIVLQDLNRLEEAEACYRRALQINPVYAQAAGNLGFLMQRLGRLKEAEASYRYALQLAPDYARAHNNLGSVLQTLGRLEEAVACYRRAMELNPIDAEAIFGLGNLLRDMGRSGEAENCYQQALQIKPDYTEARNNLGALLQETGRQHEAEACYRQALMCNPLHAKTHNNLGTVLLTMGRLDEAAASYRLALEIEPTYAEAWCNLGHILCDLDEMGQASDAYRKAVQIDPDNIGLVAAVYLAILHYLEGKPERSQSMLEKARPILAQSGTAQKSVRSYWLYLDALLGCRPPLDSNKAFGVDALYVIGESHALSAHGMVVRGKERELRCVAEWMAGCKQWHLGNSENNKYKHKFEAVMARLPHKSNILLNFGEIDCRADEGIIKVSKKHPELDLQTIVQTTIRNYLNYVTKVGGRYGHSMIVAGVPAPNILFDTSSPEMELLVRLIRMFNITLRDAVLAAGMGFLNVYEFTDRGDGIADGRRHIDSHHLLPGAVAEAFDKYLLYK